MDERDEPGVGLASAIETVRRELNEAVTTELDTNQRVNFRYQSVEIELAIALTHGEEGGAGVKAWVISADARASREHQTTHRITLTLDPYDMETGQEPTIARRAEREFG